MVQKDFEKEEKMRVSKEIIELNYDETKEFFNKRANKFTEDNPYAVTMYQDNNPEVVIARNKKEVEKLKPHLALTKNSCVLDIACGIGRWADAISEEISEYCGIDFGCELIEIAKKRNERENFFFYEGSATDIREVLKRNKKQKFNRILMAGILIYLNDVDLKLALEQVEAACDENARICFREPIAMLERLTLKNFYSEELCDNYNAIYRTREEICEILNEVLICRGFQIIEENFLFSEDSLNNRKETSQYYYVLER